jgi:3-phosphoshikimate 1-carboxyvinyltransferase
VQFDFPDAIGKPYKTSGGKMVWNEELKREIPDGWEVKTFSEWINNDKSGDWGKEQVEGNYTEKVYCIRGADINGLNGTGEIPGGALEIDASASSQFLSALLLIGPSTVNGITARHVGGELPSMPHIEMTVAMLRDFGASVDVDSAAQTWSVKSGKLTGQDLIIEPDLSNASPFLSIAMVCGGSITIADWPKSTTQPGDQLREIFTRMGAKVEFVSDGLKITGGESIHGIDIDLHDVGELTPSIAALAALADTPSHLRGIGHLRLHETDRLAALTREINGLGGNVVEDETSIHITPASSFGKDLHGGTFHTYDDHRLATAGAVIGLVVPDVLVENVATTRKTLPDFPGLWQSLVL